MCTSKVDQADSGLQKLFNFVDNIYKPWFDLLAWSIILGTLFSLAQQCKDENEIYSLIVVVVISGFLIITKQASILYRIFQTAAPRLIASKITVFIISIILTGLCLVLLSSAFSKISFLIERSKIFN